MKTRLRTYISIGVLLAGVNFLAAAQGTVIYTTALTSDHGPLAGALGIGQRFDGWALGLEFAAGIAKDVAVDGRVAPEGSRVRFRVPLIVELASDGTLSADVILSPGIRYLETGAASVWSVSAELALYARVQVLPRLEVFTGTLWPLAFDVTGLRELSLFPGVAWIVGTEVEISESLGILIQGMLGAPEGYGGDGAKSVVEAGISIRFYPEALGGTGWAQLPVNL